MELQSNVIFFVEIIGTVAFASSGAMVRGLVTIDEIKTVSCPIGEMTEDSQPMHWAQGQLYAALWLRQEGLRARCVSLSVRSAELVTRSCQQTLPRATNLTGEIAQAAVRLFDGRFSGGFPYRSAGLSCSALTPDDAPVQLDFLGDEARRIKTERLESAIDGLRRRFGHQIVRRAVVLTDGQYAQINPKEEHTVHPVPFYAG